MCSVFGLFSLSACYILSNQPTISSRFSTGLPKGVDHSLHLAATSVRRPTSLHMLFSHHVECPTSIKSGVITHPLSFITVSIIKLFRNLEYILSRKIMLLYMFTIITKLLNHDGYVWVSLTSNLT